MKTMGKKWSVLGLLLTVLVMMTAGCASGEKAAEEEKPEEVLYPVSVDGTEILVGETTVQALLDKGLKVTVSEMTPDKQINQYEIDAEEMLEANSYYSGASIWLTDSSFAHVSLATGEEAVRMGDAVIAYMEFSLSATDKTGLDKIAFNGVPVTELTREKAGEVFPDFTGDQNMLFSQPTMLEYQYFMGFGADGMLTKFSVKKDYDVDYSSGK